jgi:hypothetical protein
MLSLGNTAWLMEVVIFKLCPSLPLRNEYQNTLDRTLDGFKTKGVTAKRKYQNLELEFEFPPSSPNTALLLAEIHSCQTTSNYNGYSI